MRLLPMQIAAFGLTVVTLAANSTAQAAQASPCREIAAACRQAGFIPGGARTGDGLQLDCVQPIMLGTSQRRRAGRPLPQIDPQLVAACKANNPNFGQGNARGANAGSGNTPAGGVPADGTDQPKEPADQTGPTTLAPAQPLPAGAKRPNIVFVLADDFSMDLLQYMPRVLKMQQDGVTFANYFVTDSLCCPSRSSIFTGRYPHSTGIYRNVGQDGGYIGFVNRRLDDTTLATSLTAAGYRTAMLGKYLNGYQPRRDGAAPGWSEWDVAGNGYPGFNYDLNQNATVMHYARRPAEYLTDVVSARAVEFIKQNSDAPFMIEVATFAPHAPYTPAPRDAGAFPGLHAPRTPAFNAAPDADAPKWLASLPPLSAADIAEIDGDYKKRAQSVLAIDAMIGALQAAVIEIGAADNTYFVFSSDNGYHMGEYRMMPGKMTAYDTDIHVPLIVTGPGVPAGRKIDEIAQNIDLCPTFEVLGFAPASTSIDGRSLVPMLHGEAVDGWRTMALVEHRGPVRNLVDPDLPSPRGGNPTTYEAMRTATALYVEYADGEKEYHDLASDPDELHNSYTSLSAERKAALHAALQATQNCHGADCRSEHVERSAMRN
jgi:N-acetylglucosamine-6-sulfatase